MKKSDEIFTIECTIRNIFNKDVIKKIDVAMANNLLEKWKVLTNHVENTESPIKDNILEEEPNYKSINN
jgi:hypothetical protein